MPSSNPVTLRRHELSLTQARLAEKAGLNIRQVQKIEKGETDLGNLTFRNAVCLACALELSLEELAAYIEQ